MTTIGDRIRENRKAKGLTLEDVAKKSGVSRQTIQRYESGTIQNIPSDRIEKVASALGVTPASLMGWDEPEEDVKGYYLNAETAEIAQTVYDRPEMRLLFDTTRKATKEEIETAIDIISMLKKKRG